MSKVLRKIFAASAIAFCLGLSSLQAITVELKNGNVIDGELVKIDDATFTIRIKVANQVSEQVIKRSAISIISNLSSAERSLLTNASRKDSIENATTQNVNIDNASAAVLKAYQNKLVDLPKLAELATERKRLQQAILDDPFDKQPQTALKAVNEEIKTLRDISYAKLAVGFNHLQAGRYKIAAALLIQAGQHPTVRNMADKQLKSTLNDLIMLALRIDQNNNTQLEDYGTGWLDYNARGYDLGRKITRADGKSRIDKDKGSNGYGIVLKEYKGNALLNAMDQDAILAIERAKKIALLLQAGALDIFSESSQQKFDAISKP